MKGIYMVDADMGFVQYFENLIFQNNASKYEYKVLGHSFKANDFLTKIQNKPELLKKIDLLFVNPKLNDMNGLELIKKIYTYKKDINICIVINENIKNFFINDISELGIDNVMIYPNEDDYYLSFMKGLFNKTNNPDKNKMINTIIDSKAGISSESKNNENDDKKVFDILNSSSYLNKFDFDSLNDEFFTNNKKGEDFENVKENNNVFSKDNSVNNNPSDFIKDSGIFNNNGIEENKNKNFVDEYIKSNNKENYNEGAKDKVEQNDIYNSFDRYKNLKQENYNDNVNEKSDWLSSVNKENENSKVNLFDFEKDNSSDKKSKEEMEQNKVYNSFDKYRNINKNEEINNESNNTFDFNNQMYENDDKNKDDINNKPFNFLNNNEEQNSLNDDNISSLDNKGYEPEREYNATKDGSFFHKGFPKSNEKVTEQVDLNSKMEDKNEKDSAPYINPFSFKQESDEIKAPYEQSNDMSQEKSKLSDLYRPDIDDMNMNKSQNNDFMHEEFPPIEKQKSQGNSLFDKQYNKPSDKTNLFGNQDNIGVQNNNIFEKPDNPPIKNSNLFDKTGNKPYSSFPPSDKEENVNNNKKIIQDIYKNSGANNLNFRSSFGNSEKEKVTDYRNNANFNNVPDFAKQIVAFFSVKGGIGKTSLAVNTTIQLAKYSNKKICLIDFDLTNANVHTHLGLLDSTYDLSVISNFDSEIDSFSVNKIVTKYRTKDKSGNTIDFDVIIGNREVNMLQKFTEKDVHKILTILEDKYDIVIVDTHPVYTDPAISTILKQATKIIFVTEQEMTALNGANDFLLACKKYGIPQEKLFLVLNRYKSNTPIFSKQRIEKSLGKQILAVIPNDIDSSREAINTNSPITISNPDSVISRNFIDVAKIIDKNINAPDSHKSPFSFFRK